MSSGRDGSNTGIIRAFHGKAYVLEITSANRTWMYMPLAECPVKNTQAAKDTFKEAHWKKGDKVKYEILDDVYNPVVHRVRKV